MFFSLFRQREGTKRDHVARFESEQITILKNCAAGLALTLSECPSLIPSPKAWGGMFDRHRYCISLLQLFWFVGVGFIPTR